jgi:hypothetical protein
MLKPSLPVYLSLAVILFLVPSFAKLQPKQNDEDQSWIAKSDEYTQLLIDLDKKYSPEFGSYEGLAEYDTLVSVPTYANLMAERKEDEALLLKYKSALTTERNPHVLQDLKILIAYLELGFRQQDYELKRQVPYLNPTLMVYSGLQMLLDDQTPPARRPAAVMRIRKYAGLEKGSVPITEILRDRIQRQMAGKNMVYPSKQKMEVALARNASIVAGIEALCKKYKLTGWEGPYEKLRMQMQEYDRWVSNNVLPTARTDFRMPAEEYVLAFEQYGIDIPPAEIAKMAHEAFTQVQSEMKPIAAEIARQRHLPSADYRDVIRALKKEQLHGDSIMPVYETHLGEIEDLIRKHQLVTLPGRPAMMRIATPAETAQQPAPHMVPPPFLNNTGQRGVFVLPLNMPPAPGEKEADRYDDFTFDAASWTIIAHEVRPGHELQFDKMVEEGVSKARALYAFNSTNVEGWGLYAEYIMRPYMPLEGRLVSLDYLLLRAARAFLDPELQAGKITPDQALTVLKNDVVQSSAFAQEEVERYTLKAPGQANSYFYGFTKMIALRKDAEKALGNKFSALRFHDFVLAQGLLPPALIRDAVMKEFIPREMN